MKKLKKILVAPLFLLLIAASCIKEDNSTTLSPETQEGKNTFGCLVNNELWKNGKPTFGSSTPRAFFENNNLIIAADGSTNLDIGIFINNFIFQDSFILRSSNNEATLYDNTNHCYYTTDANHPGKLEITKFDTIKKIISGRFAFIGTKYSPPYSPSSGTCDSVVTISQGRFDLKYTEY